jgi:magnesium chelatase family protein
VGVAEAAGDVVTGFDPGRLADLAGVQNQETAKRALEIAAAGGHPILLTGPSGSGKTLLCRCLSGLLPALTQDETAAVAEIYRRAKLDAPGAPPLRAPHPSTRPMALVGQHRPGEVDLARGGVLFLDDLPSFGRRSLLALRRPLEDNGLRQSTDPTTPPPFLIAAAMRACPCGGIGDPHRECSCPPWKLNRHWSAVRELLLDLVHLHAELLTVSPAPPSRRGGEGSSHVAARVRSARVRQRDRYGSAQLNAHLPARALPEVCQLDSAGQQLLDRAADRLPFTARPTATVLRVARTIADLAGHDSITASHRAEAIQYQARGVV